MDDNEDLSGRAAFSIVENLSGRAALSIVESLLLCLSDLKLVTEDEVVGVLTDAAETHRSAAGDVETQRRHVAVADLITAILKGGNSVRHPS